MSLSTSAFLRVEGSIQIVSTLNKVLYLCNKVVLLTSSVSKRCHRDQKAVMSHIRSLVVS